MSDEYDGPACAHCGKLLGFDTGVEVVDHGEMSVNIYCDTDCFAAAVPPKRQRQDTAFIDPANIAGSCRYPLCNNPATTLAYDSFHCTVSSYCELHARATVLVNAGNPEFVSECPNCGCLRSAIAKEKGGAV